MRKWLLLILVVSLTLFTVPIVTHADLLTSPSNPANPASPLNPGNPASPVNQENQRDNNDDDTNQSSQSDNQDTRPVTVSGQSEVKQESNGDGLFQTEGGPSEHKKSSHHKKISPVVGWALTLGLLVLFPILLDMMP